MQSLFPVGWIHTHPAFDCFLSSVDMHNQFGYQVLTFALKPSSADIWYPTAAL